MCSIEFVGSCSSGLRRPARRRRSTSACGRRLRRWSRRRGRLRRPRGALPARRVDAVGVWRLARGRRALETVRRPAEPTRGRAPRVRAPTRRSAPLARETASATRGRRSVARSTKAKAEPPVSKPRSQARAGARPARRRAVPGANRKAVLAVVRERPGVTASELAAASGVTGGTLYALLRPLGQAGRAGQAPAARRPVRLRARFRRCRDHRRGRHWRRRPRALASPRSRGSRGE